MTGPDRRLTPANGRVAALHLRGIVTADAYVAGDPATVRLPVADLLASPGGPRDRQLLLGAAVTVYDRRDGWAFVQARADGYVGYLPEAALGPLDAPTHRVATPATHVYEAESFKSPDLLHLSFGARLRVTAERAKFWETEAGFVPKKHLRPLDRPFSDPVTVAQIHFGVPYLWGGNSILGIDCSGLVQAALHACDISCPGDSDLQAQALGAVLPDDAPPQRGDLYFWAGHVALAVDEATLIHANAHHMAVAYEPIAAATLRIEAQGDGPVTLRRRLG